MDVPQLKPNPALNVTPQVQVPAPKYGDEIIDGMGNKGIAKFDRDTGKALQPYKSPDGAVSSADIPTGQKQNTAIASATGTMSGAGTSTEMPSWATTLLQGLTTSHDDYNKLNAQIFSSINANYDANLAVNNAQYKGLFDQLAQQHTTEVQAGQSRAISLNPYSTAKQSSTAEQFTSALNDRYSVQYASLTAKMQAAQQALAAGRSDAYIQLSKEAAKENETFISNTASFVQNILKDQQAQANSDRNFNLASTGQASDDFRSLLTTLSGSPELQNDIKTYESSGKITPGLMPIVEKGLQAGMSPKEALSVFSYQSDAVRRQQSLEDYRANQLVLAQERNTRALDRQTTGQAAVATTQMVLATQADMRAKGVSPGSIEWATGVASATGASQKVLPISETSKYTQMGVLANQLTGIKSGIDAISSNNDLWNMLGTAAGKNVASLSDTQLATLNARLTALSGVIGKTFYGEAGNLSNTDIQRVLNALPSGAGTNELRQGLYKGLLSVARDNATLTLESDAQAGYNVAAYADSVTRIVSAYDSVTDSGSGSTSGFDYAAWAKSHGLK